MSHSKKVVKNSKRKEDIKKVEEILSYNIEPDQDYNLPDKLPFFYHLEIGEGTIKWTCALGPHDEIMSVYEMTPNTPGMAKEYQEMQLSSFEEADKVRNVQIDAGWEPTIIPKMKFNNEGKPLNREERRRVARVIVSGKFPDIKKKPEAEAPKERAKAPEWKYSDEDSDSY
jgi:hypothetical protein